MLMPLVAVMCCVCIVALFVFAYLMDKWHGFIGALALCGWVVFHMQPVHAAPIAAAPSALGGWIILDGDEHCEAPLDQWHHYIVTRADGLVVSSGCYYLSNDKQRIVAREGSTLYPIEWPSDVFHLMPGVPTQNDAPSSQYKRLDAICRGGSGDDARTWQACNDRDNLSN